MISPGVYLSLRDGLLIGPYETHEAAIVALDDVYDRIAAALSGGPPLGDFNFEALVRMKSQLDGATTVRVRVRARARVWS